LGIVLALLSGVQQGHTFCYLAGCHSPTLGEKTLSDKADSLVSSCCSRSCSRVRRQSPNKSSSSSDGEIANKPGGSCPCPPTCWCQLTPGPLGLPTSVPVSVDLLAQGLGQSFATMIQPTCCDQGLLPELKASSDASLEPVVLRCAKLCRFLI
jgi:hypothetical protein